ncbi:hypothetical protein SAMN05428964_10975 [Thalassospira xiamenensis]|uniref:Uncharacterized protein n=1 Tax=Thalassospira xiamenensis TaxID=220697 RepID=A0A285TXS1_9PROT|nr:hypothetical protein SAMN05428964_10975 [Thalassospira xiamenensis]
MLEWVKSSERLPQNDNPKSDDHIWCWAYYNGQVELMPFNPYHECWDDNEMDDYRCDAQAVLLWARMEFPRVPENLLAEVMEKRKT